jgi:hypothetical protein
MRLTEPYRPRPIRPMGTLSHEDWRLKAYGISYASDLPPRELLEAAAAIARQLLPTPACISGRYGVGYLGVHAGRGSDFVFVDWWEDENELHHHVFVSPSGEPENLAEVTHTGVSACVWDLAVICFERRAWLETVLMNPSGPDIEGYLARRLDALV